MRYAQLNEKNVCIAVSDVAGHIHLDYMIQIKENESPIGMLYKNGTWESVPVDIAVSKTSKIEHSKLALADWLANNPLYSTVHNPDGEFYTVTQEKQAQLTQMVAVAQLAEQTGVPFTITWNAVGKVCEKWTLEELMQLAFKITSYVLPRVKKQQTYEVTINSCATQEELTAIEINYDTIN